MILIPNKILELKQLQGVSTKTLRLASYVIGICLKDGECGETNAVLSKRFEVQINAIVGILKTLSEEGFIEVSYEKSKRVVKISNKCRRLLEREIEGIGVLFKPKGLVKTKGEGFGSNQRGGLVQTKGVGSNQTLEEDDRELKINELGVENEGLKKAEISQDEKSENVGSPHTPLLGERVIIRASNNNLINNINNTQTAHVHTREGQQNEKVIITPFVTIGKVLRKTADEIVVRSIPHKHISSFCEKFNGFDFDSNETLLKKVKEWHKNAVNETKNNLEGKSIEERKASFRAQINAIREHGDLYPSAHYESFFEYWTQIEVNEAIGEVAGERSKMRFEKEKTFVIKARLNWSYTNIFLKHHGKGNANTGAGGGRAASGTGKKTVYVDLESAFASASGERAESSGGIVEADWGYVE